MFNLADFEQTVHVRVSLDGPGTLRDAVLVDENVTLAACDTGSSCTGDTQGSFPFRVKQKDWPEGTYSLSVTATGSETVTAVSTFTIDYR